MPRSRPAVTIKCSKCGKGVLARRLRGKWRGQISTFETLPSRKIQLPLIDGKYSTEEFLCHECESEKIARG